MRQVLKYGLNFESLYKSAVIFDIIFKNKGIGQPWFVTRAAIRFRFTAITVNFTCVDTLRRPQPLARTIP